MDSKTSLMWPKSAICLLFAFFILIPVSRATHQMGAHIEAEPQGNLQYRLSVRTYSDPAPAGVDRCAADIEVWSKDLQGNYSLVTTLLNVPRSNGPLTTGPLGDCPITDPTVTIRDGVTVFASYKRNLYETDYTFPAAGEYELRYWDQYRTGSILNIPNPDNTPVYVTLTLRVDSLMDQPPILLNESIFAQGCPGYPWQFNPGAFDLDGDSLVYSLRSTWDYEGQSPPAMTPGFVFPGDSSLGGGTFNIDSTTGIITWANPSMIGLYVFAIKIKSYRNGQLMSTTIQEMPVLIKDCNNGPPDMQVPPLSGIQNVLVGDTVELNYLIQEPNSGDSLYVRFNLGTRDKNELFTNAHPNVTLTVYAQDSLQGSFVLDSLPVAVKNTPTDTAEIRLELTWVPDSNDLGKSLQFELLAHDNLSYLSNSPTGAMASAYHAIRFHIVDMLIGIEPERLTLQASAWLEPGRTDLWLRSQNENQQSTHYQIGNVQGQVLAEGNFRNGTHQLPLHSWPKGVYWIRMEQHGRYWVGKVIR